jgi:type II secretory pathway component GspD/PulD (secretin)
VSELPKVEQAKRLEPFRTRSEELGLALLTEEQRTNLEAIRIGRLGMVSLAEAKVATALGLTHEQRAEVERLLNERQQKIEGLDRRSATRERKNYDLQLRAMLTKDQVAEWQKLSKPRIANLGHVERPLAKKLTGPAVSTSNLGESAGKTTMRFSFQYAPWADVIEWFASQADLSLVMDAPPNGTLNYADRREYTPSQAIDLLNSVLLTKGYTLVRRDRMLMVINLEDGIPPNLVAEVTVNELDDRGEYELVRCLFTLRSANAAEVEQEISRLIGPQGAVAVLDSSNQLLITETAGRLRTFRDIIETAEQKKQTALGKATLITLTHVRARDVMSSWRKLMGLTEEDNATSDGLLRVAQGRSSRELLASGQEHRVQEFRELVRMLDVAPVGGVNGIDTPQLEVYAVTGADPTSVLEIIQTLMAEQDDVRLASDPKSGKLVALATPSQQRTIRATVEQMQQDRREVEVIRLRRVDPQLAMLSIEKLFGSLQGEESPDPNVPIVDADLTNRSLLIRGSQSQIADIRGLLAKMGEADIDPHDDSPTSGRGNLRMIPVDAATARRALDQMNNIWPSVRKNAVRVVTPSSSIRGIRPGSSIQPDEPESSDRGPLDETKTLTRARLHYVASVQKVNGASNISSDELPTHADVIVTLGDHGLLVASEDVEALDDFEDVFRTLTDQLFTGARELVVFYLKHAKAQVAAELIKQVVGGGGSGRSSGGGGSLLSTLAGAALGGSEAGGLIGSLLNVGGGSSAPATISRGTKIIADPRLNALIVQATPKELDFIEQILRVLDTSTSPETIETIPRPRTILVMNTDAEEVAEMVQKVYASRMTGQGSRRREPTPEEFLRAMSGQKNSSKDIKDEVSEQLRMSISVDRRRNALIVVAPDSLFLEVEELVAQLDVARPDLQETIRVQTVRTSPENIRNALASILGQETRRETRRETTKNAQRPANGVTREPPTESAETQSPEEIKRRMEFFKAIQRANAKKDARQAKPAKK